MVGLGRAGSGCETGQHPSLEPQPPVHRKTTVTVDWQCPACGVVALSESFTTEAWEHEQAKPTSKRKKPEPLTEEDT